jgi:hypothetical protein
MNPEDDTLRARPSYRQKKENLDFFTRAIGKRFPGRTERDVEDAILQAKKLMAPSIDRARLKREVLRILNGR